MAAPLNDTELIAAFQQGNAQAFHQLYELHYRSLCWFADKLVNSKEDAEDIVLDNFEKLWKKKADFDNLKELRSFLYTATRNACYNYIRDHKRHDASHKELHYLASEDASAGYDEELMAKVLAQIYKELDNLPEQCRLVFKSIFLEGKTTRATAASLGISPQTVLNQKSKALQLLRLSLYKEGLFSMVIFLQCLSLLTQSRQA